MLFSSRICLLAALTLSKSELLSELPFLFDELFSCYLFAYLRTNSTDKEQAIYIPQIISGLNNSLSFAAFCSLIFVLIGLLELRFDYRETPDSHHYAKCLSVSLCRTDELIML